MKNTAIKPRLAAKGRKTSCCDIFALPSAAELLAPPVLVKSQSSNQGAGAAGRAGK